MGKVQNGSTASVEGDAASSSLDEVPIDQSNINDSRSHIAFIQATVGGGTGTLEASADNTVLTFERGQLFLDPDEALFMNNKDVSGALSIAFGWNLWYED